MPKLCAAKPVKNSLFPKLIVRKKGAVEIQQPKNQEDGGSDTNGWHDLEDFREPVAIKNISDCGPDQQVENFAKT